MAPQVVGEVSESSMRRLLVGILLGGLLVRLVHFWSISGTAFPKIPLVFDQSDMYAFWQWAQTILSGDILGRNTYHPYFNWMKAIAPLDTWYRWWGGKEIFQQAPLYAYWVAGLLAASKNSLNFVLFVQLMVGALQPLIMFFLGKRLFDERSGLVAAALTAFYGPFIFYQGTLLRDWLPPILEPLALLLLIQAQQERRGRDWLSAGAALGLALLAKENVILFLPLVGLWILWEEGFVRLRAIGLGALVLAGLVVSISPLLVRNAAVGAPLLASSGGAAGSFIIGNVADGFPVGATIPGSMKSILERSDGRLIAVIRETLKTYNGNWLKFVKLELVKFRGVWDPLEVADNLSFYYGLEVSPILRFMLSFGVIVPLGLAGLVVSLKIWRRHLLLILYGVATFASLIVPQIIGRYRLVLVPVLIVYGAGGLVWLGKTAQKKKMLHGIAYCGLIAALAVVQQFLLPVREVRDEPISAAIHGGLEYQFSATIYASDGLLERALLELDRLKAKAEQNPNFAPISAEASRMRGDCYAIWAQQLLNRGNQDEARRQARQARAEYSAYLHLSIPNYNLGVLYFRLKEAEEAKFFLHRFLELEPEGQRADVARRLRSKLENSR